MEYQGESIVKHREVDNIIIIQLDTDLNEENRIILKNYMTDLILKKEKQIKAILLIFGQIKVVDSQALGLIISLHHEAEKHQIKFALCNVGELNIEVIKLAQLDRLITIYPTEEEALKGLKG